MKKNQAQEVINNFKKETIREALEIIESEEFVTIKTKDLPDPGLELELGKENRVSYENLDVLERIIGRRNFLPVSFLEEGSIVQRAVARITFKDSGSTWATGFLISNSIFMTNNHAISSKEKAKQFKIQFDYKTDLQGNPVDTDDYTLDPDNLFYTNRNLDFTIVRVQKKCNYGYFNGLGTIPLNTGLNSQPEYTPNPFGTSNIDRDYWRDRLGGDWYRNPFRICFGPGYKHGFIPLNKNVSYAEDQFLNIIQHPRGRRKEIAIQENTVTNIYVDKIRYTTDTEPGSSGSPVFNNLWDLVAIHHAAGERDPDTNAWISNQGIRIDKIMDDIKEHYDGTITGRNILMELGIL